jgi:hypothetical protein
MLYQPANKDQYALLFGWIYPQILRRLGYDVNAKNISRLHEEFKEYLGYETISGVAQGVAQRFIWEVMGVCSMELGIYISEPDQPLNADNLPITLLWKKNDL